LNKWLILGIDETDNSEEIKQAYRKQLSKHNPEDDPDGFMRLRSAYEQILKELDDKSKVENADSSPLGQFMKRVNDVYNGFSLRCDKAVWRELLADECCMRLDMQDATEEKLLIFLIEHYYLPQEIWALLDSHFGWSSKKESLKCIYPPNFIDFILDTKSSIRCRYDLFVLDPEYHTAVTAKQFDSWFRLYYEIQEMLHVRNFDNEHFTEIKNEIEASPIKHVYYDLQKAHLHLAKNEAAQALAITEPIFAQLPDDLEVVLTHSEALSKNSRYQESLDHLRALAALYPEDIEAKRGIASALISLEDYESARALLLEVLDEYPDDVFATISFRLVTGKLIKVYEEKHQSAPNDLEIAMTLAKHYLNNRLHEQTLAILEKISPPPENTSYYEYLADCHVFKGNFEEAITNYEASIAIEHSARNSSKLVTAMIAIEKYDEALKYIESTLTLKTNDKLWLLHLYWCKGLIMSKTDRLEDALDSLDEALTINDQVARVYVLKAQILQTMGRVSEALDCCQQSIRISPYNSSEAYTIQMEIYNNAGMYEHMLEIADQAEQVDFISPHIKYHKAGALRLLGEHEQAREIVDALLESDQKDEYRDYFHLEAAFLAEIEGDYTRAVSHLQKSIDLAPDVYRYTLLAKMKRLKGDYDGALTIYDRLLSENPDDISALMGRGELYISKKEFSQAQTDFNAVLAIDEENEETYRRIIASYGEEKRYDKALDWAMRLLDKFERIENQVWLANLYWEYGQLDNAEAEYRKAIERYPNSWLGPYYYGYYLSRRHRHDEAVLQFTIATEMNPEEPDLYEELYYSLIYLKRCEEALAVLVKREALDDYNLGEIIVQQSIALEYMGRYSEALEKLFAAVELGDRLNGYWMPAQIYTRIGVLYDAYFNDVKNAIKYYTIALELDSNCYDAYWYLGDMDLHVSKDYQEAIDKYTQHIELNPDEPRVYIKLAQAYAMVGEDEKACDGYKKALKLNQEKNEEDPSPCYEIYDAVCYMGLGQVDIAKEIFLRMINAPALPGSWCNKSQCDVCLDSLGKICEEEGNFSEALAYYEKAIAACNYVKYNVSYEELKKKMKDKGTVRD